MKFINLRGCNGSGKTTVLRQLMAEKPHRLIPVHQPLHQPPKPGQAEDPKHPVGSPKGKPIPITLRDDGIAALGDYTAASKGCVGCDRIARQDDIKTALVNAAALREVSLVLFEGVIVATIFGTWLEWERANGGMVWAFLDTPLDKCIERVKLRNGGQSFMEDKVAEKHRYIAGVQRKVLSAYPAGGRVASIRWDHALADLNSVIAHTLHGNSEALT